MKRTISALLAFLMAASIVSCGGSGEVAETTTAVQGDVTTDAPVETENVDLKGYLLDDLPDNLDFGGETVTVLGWNHYEAIEFYAEEETGDVVNDAYYSRNLAVEERLDIEFEFLESNARGGSEFPDQLNKSIMSGSGEYDIAAAHSHRAAVCAYNGYLVNLFDIEHIDLEKPWWVQSLVSKTSVGDALYFASGDISVSYLTRLQGIAFNFDLLDDYKLENPYDLVLSGNWTNDKMIEMTKGVYADLNSNGQKDEKDRFGLGADVVQLQSVIYPSGLRTIDKDESGKLTISSSYTGEKMVNIIDKFANLLHATDDASTVATVDDISMYTEGRALFFIWPLGILQSGEMRNAKFDYGFVTGPKYDKEQEDYYSSSSNAFSLWGIPIDAKNTEMSGAVMEALASQGYRTTTPALFEVAYKVKYNADTSEKQSQIFDILRASVQYDFGKIFATVIGDDLYGYANMIFNNNANWVSHVEGFRSIFETKLGETEKAFAENASK